MNLLRLLSVTAFSLLTLTSAHAGSLTAGDRKQFDPIAAGISAATEVTLFEGLPHQMFDRDSLATELKTKQTVQLHGYPFYKRPLPLSAEDAAALRRLLTNKASFETFGGEKACGGFHPDYSIAWAQGGQTFRVLICFGCHEFKMFGAGHELRTDSDDTAMKKIEAILRKYHAQRPKPRNG
jgi:hypothetical protein